MAKLETINTYQIRYNLKVQLCIQTSMGQMDRAENLYVMAKMQRGPGEAEAALRKAVAGWQAALEKVLGEHAGVEVEVNIP